MKVKIGLQRNIRGAAAAWLLASMSVFGGLPGEIFVVLYTPTTIDICQKRIPQTFASLNNEYTTWLQKQHAEIKAMAKELETKKADALSDPQIQQHIKRLGAMSAEELREQCRALSGFLKGETEKPNPALTTPERAWKTFHAAMLAKDRKAARSCLASSALNNFRRTFDGDDGAKMSAWARNVKHFKTNAPTGPEMVDAVVTTVGGRAYIVTMLKVGPNWLIAEM